MVADAGFEPVCLSLIKRVLIHMSLPATVNVVEAGGIEPRMFTTRDQIYSLGVHTP